MLEQQLDRMPTVDELAELLGMDPKEVNKSLNDKNNYVSLDTPISNDEDSGTLYEILENLIPIKRKQSSFTKIH